MRNPCKKSTQGLATGFDLPRVLGFRDIVGIFIGGVIGPGIFIVPASIATRVQPLILILAAWYIGELLSFFGALSFSELGAVFPCAGGTYIYLREAHGLFLCCHAFLLA